jgi:putative membrane protein
MTRLVLAALHLIALGIGLGAVWVRSRSLRGNVGPAEARRAFVADAWWGAAAALWLVTGLWRLFGETEKPVNYYFSNHVFLAKLGLFVLVVILEIWPMVTLARWRKALGRGETPSFAEAGRISTISVVEAVLVVAIVGAAVTMARGFGAG